MFISVILTTLLAIFHMIPNVPILTLLFTMIPWSVYIYNHSPFFNIKCYLTSLLAQYALSPFHIRLRRMRVLPSFTIHHKISKSATTMIVLLPSLRILSSPVSRKAVKPRFYFHMLSFSIWSCLFLFPLYLTVFVLFT